MDGCVRLLLADDNDMNVELFSAALDAYDVVIVRDGAEALEAGLAERFDLILLDVQMPRLDGNEVCRALRSAGVTTPIVALSAAAMPSDVARGHLSGFDDYLTKPISPQALVAAVKRHVRPAA
jgi:CheY-like chemotaxis protein